MKNIIEFAQARGSNAQTNVEKARNYLLAYIKNMPSVFDAPLSKTRTKTRTEYKLQQQVARFSARMVAAPNSYKKSKSSWAGGEHYETYDIVTNSQEISAEGHSTREWSRNGKWSGNNSHVNFKISRRCLSLLQGQPVVGGLVTLDAEKTECENVLKIKFAKQSRGFDLAVAECFLVNNTYHVTAKTPAGALKKYNKIEEKLKLDKAYLEALKNIDNLDLKRIFVDENASLQSGNCKFGTDAFISGASLSNIGAIRADYLLELRNDTFTRKAVAMAKALHY